MFASVMDSTKHIEEHLLQREEDLNVKLVTPYAAANIFSRLLFSWMNSLLSHGYRKRLEEDDIPQVAEVDSTQQSYQRFNYYLRSGNQERSIGRATVLFCYQEILLSALYASIYCFCSYVGPYTIDVFVEYLEEKRKFGNQGYFLVGLFLGSKIIQSLTQHQWNFKTIQAGLRIRAALIAMLYRKGIMLSNKSKLKCSSGEVINRMSVDAQRIGDYSRNVNYIFRAPLQILVGLGILFSKLGPSAFASIAATVIVMVVNFPILNLINRYEKLAMEWKDKRMRATSEILKNMKILKLQAWETKFLQKIEQLRELECTWIRKGLYFVSFVVSLYWGAPAFISAVTFGTSFLVGVPLTAGKLLSALATLRVLQEPLLSLPDLITKTIQAKVSLGRLAAFMELEELPSDAVTETLYDASNIAVQIQGGIFSWHEDPNCPTLKRINVNIMKGTKVAICGTVGSGKSSLLSCILGEMPKFSGTVTVNGSKAYVPQSPWIPTGKIRDIILFGKAMDIVKYNKVLQTCSLQKDLDMFPNGDLTEIGERGINLSGGQKQRIQIARALYQEQDIYLFDDPFSALDAHTGSHIFKECIVGMAASKTVIYVTHQVEFLPNADIILVMREGVITEAGKFDEIRKAGSDFVKFVDAHWKSLEEIDSVDNNTSQKPEIRASLGDLEAQTEAEEAEPEFELIQKFKDDKTTQVVQEEERDKGRVNFKVYWSYLSAVCNGAFIPVILFAHVLYQLLQILSNYWLAVATPATEHQRSAFSYSFIIMVYVALNVCSSLCILARAFLVSIIGFKTAKLFFRRMHRCIFRAPISFFDATPIGRILSRASSDQTVMDAGTPFDLGSLAFSFINLMGTIGVLTQVAWEVFLVFIPVAAVSIWYQQYYMPTARELNRMSGVLKAPILQHYSESISGASIIRGFDCKYAFMEKNIHLNDAYAKSSFHASAAMEWLCLRMDLLSNFIFACSLALLICLPEGVISPGIAGLAVAYGLTLNAQQAQVISSLCNVENRIISVERILQYSNVPSEALLVVEKSRPESAWPFRGTVEIKNLQVRYGPNLPLVLKNLTCTFAGGTRVGIVGRTGSGKSTLIQSLFRAVEPVNGTISIDGIDISTIGLYDLRSKLSIIPQDPTMFEGTIRNNMDPLEEHSDHEIWEALDSCELGSIVRSKDGKLDSAVAENGENWSVGQRQLVCLARALLKQSKILVLDEATASVDTATDCLLQQTIRIHFSMCTVITVAHRIPSVIDSHNVLVLEDGEIAEYDTPSKLLENKSSFFAKLVAESSARSNHSRRK